MSLIAGVDGCPVGWICVTRDTRTGRIASALYPTADGLVSQQPCPDIIAIDMPIGLTDAGRRQCDNEARSLLGTPRRNSVFPAPIRPALRAGSRAQASQITKKADGRRVGVQAWGIFHKVRELDTVLSQDLQQRVREVHPELCFWAWNGHRPMVHTKKSKSGKAERRRLIDGHYGGRVVDQVRARYLVGQVGHDDIYDAFAALWTAERIKAGVAAVIPESPATDSVGLRMGIWY